MYSDVRLMRFFHLRWTFSPDILSDFCLTTWYIKLKYNVWWRHQMETFSALLVICSRNSRHRWIPRTKASDAELWCFLWSAPVKRMSTQSWGRWFETPSRSLWRHCNGCDLPYIDLQSLDILLTTYVHNIWKLEAMAHCFTGGNVYCVARECNLETWPWETMAITHFSINSKVHVFVSRYVIESLQ